MLFLLQTFDFFSFRAGETTTNHSFSSTAAPVSIASTTGKAQPKTQTTKLGDSIKGPACKRNHSIGNILDTSYVANFSTSKCSTCSQQTLATAKQYPGDAKRQSICTLDHPSAMHPLAHIKPRPDGRFDWLSTKHGCVRSVSGQCPMERVSCGLLGSRNNATRPKSCHLPISGITPLAIVDIECDTSVDDGGDALLAPTNGKSLRNAKNCSLLSVDSASFSNGGSSGQTSIYADGKSMSPSSPGTISLSKSETNIFEGNDSQSKLAIYNVVSLNDLNVSESFLNRRQMNDLSKNLVLNNISEYDLNELNKKNLANDQQQQMITISMSGEIDADD